MTTPARVRAVAGSRRTSGRGAVTTATVRKLLAAARAAQRRAYAPYSQFPVGAALLTVSGRIISGCNVENASYGLTLCAERSALATAVSAGHRKFRALAIVAPGRHVTPCGACRQVLAEFGNVTVICADARRRRPPTLHRLAELLPRAFKL